MYLVVAMILWAYWHLITIQNLIVYGLWIVIRGIEIKVDGKSIHKRGKK